jgi:hypothetical protein
LFRIVPSLAIRPCSGDFMSPCSRAGRRGTIHGAHSCLLPSRGVLPRCLVPTGKRDLHLTFGPSTPACHSEPSKPTFFSSRFVPAKRSACAGRNLSSLGLERSALRSPLGTGLNSRDGKVLREGHCCHRALRPCRSAIQRICGRMGRFKSPRCKTGTRGTRHFACSGTTKD